MSFHLFHPADAYPDEPVFIKDERTPNCFMYVAAYVIRPVARALWRLQINGRENIPKAGEDPVVFVANHVSYADAVFLWISAYPPGARILARSNLWRIPVLRGIISRVGAIPVDPDSADTKSVKRAVKALKRGENIGIFAEGTRMRAHDKVYKPHAGFVLIANMGKAKIVPVGITGADRIHPPGHKISHFPKCRITYGEPISLDDFADLPKGERTKAIVDETMRRVFALRDEADPHEPIRRGLPPFGIVSDEDRKALLGEDADD